MIPIPRRPQPSSPARPRAGGFTLVSAIFLLVVLVVLGASVVTLSSVQQSTSTMRIQSLRAHYAARAGLEWAIRRTNASLPCDGSSFDLDGFLVEVGCTGVPHDLDGATRTYRTVTAEASRGAWDGIDYVSRRLQVKVLGP